MRPRPKALEGQTQSISTSLGKAFITVNEHDAQPFEVFINIGKSGSETAAIAEGFGRLLSYIFRLDKLKSPRCRMKDVIEQLSNIGGCGTDDFPASLPDAISWILLEFLSTTEPIVEEG